MLSEYQMLLLNNIIYQKEFTKTKGDKTVKEILEDIDMKKCTTCEMSPKEWQDIKDQVLADKELASLKVTNAARDDKGAGMACFVDGSGQAYAVFQGTAGGEWKDNFDAAGMVESEQQKRALEWIDKLPYDDIIVSGHSKGGNKAMYVSVLSDKVKECYAFDGQGFSYEFCEQYKELILKNKHKINLICHSDDYVNILLINIAGNTKYVDRRIKNAIKAHCPNSMLLADENGNLWPGDQNTFMAMMNGFILYFMEHATPDERKFVFDTLGDIAAVYLGNEGENADINKQIKTFGPEAGEIILHYMSKYLAEIKLKNPELFFKYKVAFCRFVKEAVDGITHIDALIMIMFPGIIGVTLVYGTSVEVLAGIFDSISNGSLEVVYGVLFKTYVKLDWCRDFSEKTKRRLIETIREIDNEKFWDVEHWDCWYRIEKKAKLLDIRNYTANVNEYHRKIMDINDTSVDTIKEIFDKVYSIDRRYAKYMQENVSRAQEVRKKLNAIYTTGTCEDTGSNAVISGNSVGGSTGGGGGGGGGSAW